MSFLGRVKKVLTYIGLGSGASAAKALFSERFFELRLILASRLAQISSRTRGYGFLIGPTNSANQATQWARALDRSQKKGESALSLRIRSDPTKEWFAADLIRDINYRKQLASRVALLHELFSPKRNILIKSLTPLFSFRKGSQGFLPKFAVDDIILLSRMGKKVGVVFHGSDIRDPQKHASRNPFSPFNPEGTTHAKAINELTERSALTRSLIPALRKRKIPLFVTTPDLFLEVSDAIWLPAVIDLPLFNEIAERNPIFVTPKLRVLYLPSNSWIKSSALILPVLEKLASEGVIEYRNWIENGPVTHNQIPKILAGSDVVVDQFIGATGVFALEAAAAGRVVLTYVDETHPTNPILPHVQVTPKSLEAELRRLSSERWRATMRMQVPRNESGNPILPMETVPIDVGIAAAKDFVEFYHSGNYSANVLRENFRVGTRKNA